MTDSETQTQKSPGSRSRYAGLIVVIALAALVLGGLGGFFLAKSLPSADDEFSLPDLDDPTLLSQSELRELSSYLGPIYWDGPEPDSRYEVTLASGGAVYVRYLPSDAEVGTDSEYLAIATYRSANGPIEDFTSVEGAVEASGGALIVQNEGAPNSAYFSFPGASFQVEVFSPEKGEALDLVQSGSVTLVE